MMTGRLYKVIGYSLFLLGVTTSVRADISSVAAQIPGVFDAGQAQKNLLERTTPLQYKLPATIKEATTQKPTAKLTNKINLKLTKVYFVGNTVFSSQQLEKIYAPSLNKTISLADLDNLTQQITKLYRENGYILSRAILPPQEIKNGIVKVQIIEGYISHVTIEGNPGITKSLLERYAQHAIQSRPLKINKLERAVLISNDIPGLNVKSVITPSKDTPASAELTLITDRKRVSGYIDYDNYAGLYLGPQEVSLGGNINSILFAGDTTAVHLSRASIFKKLQSSELSYTKPFGGDGATFTFDTSYIQTQPGVNLDVLDIVSRSFLVYANIAYPVVRTRTHNIVVRGQANYQNVTSTILAAPFYQDRMRSLNFDAYFDNVDHWRGSESLDVSIEQGFAIFGADMHTLQSRPRGRTKYTRSMLNASRLQPLGSGHFSFYTGIEGQYAFNPLLTTNQFSFGGSIFGRGYEPSEIVADRGLGGKVELRYDSTPAFKFLQTVEYYAFYDAGVLWNLDKFDLPFRQTATSTGLGARLNFIPQVSGEVFLAKPLSRQVNVLLIKHENPTQARVFFQLIARV